MEGGDEYHKDHKGRHLRSKMCNKCPREKYNLKGANSSKEINSSSKVDVVEDFRPTTPGHSPGVGHSIKH
ncbi:hypothetical protein LguiB_009243 [Lonicera macranthoides]